MTIRGPKPKPIAERLLSKASTPLDGCWEWTASLDSQGRAFLMVGSKSDGTRTSARAARLSYEEFVGPIPDGMCVLHRCDNPKCIRPGHLFLGTQADNVADMVAKGRQASGESHGWFRHPDRVPRGERNGRSKLSHPKAREIRHRYASGGVSQRALAGEYGVTLRAIQQVLSGKTWVGGGQ